MAFARFVSYLPVKLVRALVLTLNQVETSLEPLELLDAIQSIEIDLGRKKLIDKGPRSIDLDILLYDQQVFSHERLSIPHKLMLERDFVLRPLSQYVISVIRSHVEKNHNLTETPPDSSLMNALLSLATTPPTYPT